MIRVFLVDDEIATRESIRNFFPWEESGYTLVGEAPDGEIALPMIQDSKPDILITDIRMPFMDGLELSQEIKRIMPWIKIVILSGYDDFSYAQKASPWACRSTCSNLLPAASCSPCWGELSKAFWRKSRPRKKSKASTAV